MSPDVRLQYEIKEISLEFEEHFGKGGGQTQEIAFMGYIQLSLVIFLRLSVCYRNMGRKNL